MNQVVSRPIYDLSTLCLDVRSGLIAAALATMLVATAPEEFGTPECTDTKEAAAYSRTSGESTHLFFCPSPLPFGGSTVLSLTMVFADQRGIEPPPAVCQRHKSAAIPTAPRGRLCLRPYPPQFLKYEHIPLHPLHTMIPQSKIIILCSICTHTQTLRTATSCFTKMSSLCRNLHFDLCFGG